MRVYFNLYMQGVREYATFTSYVGRFAYDEGNERFRFLEGLEDEREPLYAHYFFYKEVWLVCSAHAVSLQINVIM